MFKGTDPDAFRRAGKGKTKFTRSMRYKFYKAQNAKKRENTASFPSLNPTQSTLVQPTISRPPYRGRSVVVNVAQKQREQNVQRYKEKENILDDIRDYRSSKIVSNISNNLATFIVRCGGRQWDNATKNIVRSAIALAVSEITNKSLEKPMEIINNIKLFIKVGKTIYKIITWIDKLTKLFTTDEKSISIVSEDDVEYLGYIREYPRLMGATQIINVHNLVMRYKVGDTVLLKNGKVVRISKVDVVAQKYYVVSLDRERLEFVITESEISELIKRI